MAVNNIIPDRTLLLYLAYFVSKAGNVSIKTVSGSIACEAAFKMIKMDGLLRIEDETVTATVRCREYIDAAALCREFRTQLSNINVHAPSVSASQTGKGATVDAEHGNIQ